MARLIITALISVLLPVLALAGSPAQPARISPRVSEAVATDGASALQRVILYVDSTGVADRPVAFSEAALRRRARGDGRAASLDRYDYPVRESVVDAVRQSGVTIHGVSRWLKAIIVEADATQIANLATLPSIAAIDLDRTLRAPRPEESVSPGRMPPSQTATLPYGLSYPQNRFVNDIKLHDAGLTGQGVKIAVFDSGFDIYHRAFDSASIVATWDFINGDATVDEPGCTDDAVNRRQNWHGTLTLGTMAGYVPDTLVGTAPGADYLLAKTEISCYGTEIKIEETNWILASEWADSAGADIISSSLGYITFQDTTGYTFADLNGHTAAITLAAEIAASKNILVVNSAGNERGTAWGHIDFPADGDSVIAVGAVRFDSVIAPFSSPGPTSDGRIKPDIVTLGVNVFSAAPTGWTYGSGTSFSAPQVAGCCALALEHDTTLTAAELRDLIHASGNLADNPNNDFGWGLFDAVKTADIIHFDIPRRVSVSIGNSITQTVLTAGRSRVVPTLGAFDLPSWISFTDNGDGTGRLDITGDSAAAPVTTIGLTADVGYFVDTTYLLVETGSSSRAAIIAAPNPFRNEVAIYVSGAAGEWRSVTIFNTAGETVWEQVNNSPVTSDSIIRWNGTNAAGETVASGVYVAVVSTTKTTAIVKVLKTN